jgi:23S rRNA pseudouridine2605 synthase
MDNKDTMRLNKYLAHAGICSRRKAEEHIKAGQVTVNDEVFLDVGHRVSESDVVKFKGKIIKPITQFIYLLMNKPKNVITTVEDDRNRRTVMDLIRNKIKERVYPVGRLDRNTTGLLLLTNDGDLSLKLTHPKFEVKKIYHVYLDKPLSEEHLESVRKGLVLEDGPAPVDKADYVKDGDKSEIGLEIHIGRNRIVRRIFEHLGYEVVKLDRVYYAGLTKKDLPRGRFRELSEKEVIMLKHFV